MRTMQALGALAALVVLGIGCRTVVHTKYSEMGGEVDADGVWHESHIEGSAKSKAGIFGQIPAAAHAIDGTWAGDRSTLNMGQTAVIDNSVQVQALQSGLEALVMLGQIAGPILGNLAAQRQSEAETPQVTGINVPGIGTVPLAEVIRLVTEGIRGQPPTE